MSNPIAEYVIRYDDAYFRSVKAALRPLEYSFRWLPAVLVGGSILLFLLFSAIALADGDWLTVVIPGIAFVGYLVYLRKRAPKDVAHFRRAVDFGSEVRIAISADEVTLRGEAANTELRWRAFRDSSFRTDGILLRLKDGSALWLPDSSLK